MTPTAILKVACRAEVPPSSATLRQRLWRPIEKRGGTRKPSQACAQTTALHDDFDHDTADLNRTVDCPALVLCGADGAMAQAYDVPGTWRNRLSDMGAASIPGGHFFVDQSPASAVRALADFLHPAAPCPMRASARNQDALIAPQGSGSRLPKRSGAMSDHHWLHDVQMAKLAPFFPNPHGSLRWQVPEAQPVPSQPTSCPGCEPCP